MEQQQQERKSSTSTPLWKRLCFGTYYAWRGVWHFCLKHAWAAVAVVAVVGGLLLWGICRSCTEPPVALSVGFDKHIDITPEEITRIESIGQWEFLAVSTEEMVDTLQRGFLADRRLVRIYQGTLRMGIDLHEADTGWVRAHGDTVSLRLPRVRLLDDRFVDEARTRSFYEKGQWDAAAREALCRKAARQMRRRCLTQQNIRVAEDNARTQFAALFKSFGFKTVEIEFK